MRVGHVAEIVQYPVKSMAGVPTPSAVLGWHGFGADRRFAFRRVNDESGMPWLTASRLPAMVLYQPIDPDERTGLPARVRTPDGRCFALRSAEFRDELALRFGRQVELMQLDHGIFDEAPISVIALATIAGIGREAGLELDRRRFRANIFVETEHSEDFLEDAWVGGTLLFGDRDPRPAVRVVTRDLRCSMVDIDPDSGEVDRRVMKTVVRLNGNNAGVYATVLCGGAIRRGDSVSLVREAI